VLVLGRGRERHALRAALAEHDSVVNQLHAPPAGRGGVDEGGARRG